MPQILDKILENPRAAAAWEQLSPDEKQDVLTRLYPERPDEPDTVPPESPSFLQTIGRAGREAAADTVEFAGGMIPGPLAGALGGAGGSLLADLIRGDDPDYLKAGAAGATSSVLGGLGKLAGPLSKLRIAGTGRGKDATMVADAIGAAKPSMQTTGTPEALQDMMRGQQGKHILSDEFATATDQIRGQLPTAGPAPITRPDFDTHLTKIRELGKRGKTMAGNTRDNAGADTALQDREALIEQLRHMLDQTSPGLKKSYDTARGEYAAGSSLRRLFKESGDLSPERVLSSKGLSVRELQDRATKHQARLESGLGQQRADDFMAALFRGGRPPMGDKRLAIPLTKLGGFNIPLGLEYLAGPGVDPGTRRLLQMLLQGTGTAGRMGVQDMLDGGGGR